MIYLQATVIGFLSLLVFFGVCVLSILIMEWLTKLFPVLGKPLNNWQVIIVLLMTSLMLGLSVLKWLGWWKP